MAGKRILSVEFLGPDVQKSLEDMGSEIFAEKAVQKQNNIINKGMKEGAQHFKKMLSIAMAPFMNTGASYVHLQIARIKKTGGWRVSSAKRKDLQDSYPDQDIVGSKFYYPAVQEKENESMSKAFHPNMSALRGLVVNNIKAKIDKEVKKYIRKQKRMK